MQPEVTEPSTQPTFPPVVPSTPSPGRQLFTLPSHFLFPTDPTATHPPTCPTIPDALIDPVLLEKSRSSDPTPVWNGEPTFDLGAQISLELLVPTALIDCDEAGDSGSETHSEVDFTPSRRGGQRKQLPNTPSSIPSMSTTSIASRGNWIRISKKHAPYGHVQGSQRGTHLHRM